MEICKVCEKPWKNLFSLSLHFRQSHRITAKEYYDRFLKKKPQEGKCRTCGGETSFLDSNRGYLEHCSYSCCNSDPIVQSKMRSGWLKKYGVSHPTKRSAYRDKRRIEMLNGGAVYVASFIKNPSKPQIELFNLASSIYQTSQINYPVYCSNQSYYLIDIAVLKLKVAIEYDEPYWHQDKKRERERQENLEKDGWKFVRYRGYIPSKDELLRDFSRILEEE